MKYRNVGNHAEDLADGRMVAPGEFVELDDDAVREPRNEDLIAIGVLYGVDDEAEHEAQLASRRVKSRTEKQTAAADPTGAQEREEES